MPNPWPTYHDTTTGWVQLHTSATGTATSYLAQRWRAPVFANLLDRARYYLTHARPLSVAPAPSQPRSQWAPATRYRLRVLRTCGRSGWISRPYRRRRVGGSVA